MRRINRLALDEGEEIVLKGQGAFKFNVRSGWRPGHISLTDKRLILAQPNGITFEIPINRITGLKVSDGKYVLGKRKVISLSYQSPIAKETSNILMIVSGLENWIRNIYRMAFLGVDEDEIKKIVPQLDSDCERIVWHLWENRHATIDELSQLIDAPTHMDVLMKIGEIINPAAERIIGHPLLYFESTRIDPETGEKVLFSWWLVGRNQETGLRERQGIFDVIDEGDHLNIVMELLGAQEEDILLKVGKDRLIVTAGGFFKKEVLFPTEIIPRRYSKRYNNGVLALRLHKADFT